jgi:hypothetical protein
MVHEFAPVAKLLDTSLLEAANVGACSMSRNNVPDIFPVPPEKKVVWYILYVKETTSGTRKGNY